MQSTGANSSVELVEGRVAAPLEAAWDSIRSGLRRDLGARTFDGWLKPAELGAFEPDSGTLDVVMPSQFMADWVRSHFGERLTLAWKTVLPVVRNVRVMAAADAPRPAPLLILDESSGACRARPKRAEFRPALSLRDLHRRQGERGRGDRCAHAGDVEDGRLQSPFRPRRHRPRQDPLAARDRPQLPRPQPRFARRFDVGREVHGRVHPRAERE